MANLVAADVTSTVLHRLMDARGNKMHVVQLAFGDGAKTYPAGGVPLTGGNMGLPNTIKALIPFGTAGASVGYNFQFDQTAQKLLITQAPVQSHSHTLNLKNAAVADGAATRVNAGTNLLGANSGSDIAVAGGGANGGIASATLAAAGFSELSTIAIAAQTIFCLAIGY